MENIIGSFDHGNLLQRAIQDVKEELYVVSYGINNFGFSADIMNLIENKMKCGVNFYFVIGLKDDFNSNKSLGRLFYLKFWSKRHNYTGNIYYSLEKGKHGKILIKDCDYAVVGSYNWLTSSSSNTPWENYSMVTKDKVDIEILKKTIVTNNSKLIENLNISHNNNILDNNFDYKKVNITS